MHWLFGSHEAFAERFAKAVPAEAERAASESRAAAPKRKEVDGVTEALVALMDGSGLSVSAAAKKVGVDVTTAAVRLARLGRQINRRPKTLDSTARARLVADLRRGLNKEDVALRHKVSLSTVTRILRTTPGLQTTWHEIRDERDRKQARSKWSRLVARHRHAGVKTIRALAPAVYAWLYRNDHAWLTECNQQVARGAHSIVTARNAPAEMRVIKTLRHWNVYVNEMFFLGGVDKAEVLKAFRPHIFFDDQDAHLEPAAKHVPSAKVPYKTTSPLNAPSPTAPQATS